MQGTSGLLLVWMFASWHHSEPVPFLSKPLLRLVHHSMPNRSRGHLPCGDRVLLSPLLYYCRLWSSFLGDSFPGVCYLPDPACCLLSRRALPECCPVQQLSSPTPCPPSP